MYLASKTGQTEPAFPSTSCVKASTSHELLTKKKPQSVLCSTSQSFIQTGTQEPCQSQILKEDGNSAATGLKVSFIQKHKFVGRRIQHEWVINDETGEKKWFHGIIVKLVKGKNGSPKAVYEVKYDNEDLTTEVDNLLADLKDGSLKILDE